MRSHRPTTTPAIRGWTFVGRAFEERDPREQDGPRGQVGAEGQGGGKARLSYMGHALMENDNGLLMDFLVSRVTGRAEREAVPVMLDDARQRGYRPRTLGADKGYDT